MRWEAIFLGTVLLVSIFFLVGTLPRRSRAIVPVLLVGMMVVAAVFCAGLQYRNPLVVRTERVAEDRPIAVPDGGYVTSNQCRACHPDEYESWHASWHRSMTQVAGPDSVAGEFDGREMTHDGATYVAEQRGDEFWVDMPDPNWPGLTEFAEPPRIQRPVVMTSGSHRQRRGECWLTGGKRPRPGRSPAVQTSSSQTTGS
jgi:hypothetical protein